MSDLERKVEHILAQKRQEQKEAESQAAAMVAAKPEAFEVFKRSSKESARILSERAVKPETSKKIITGYEIKGTFRQKKVPITQDVAGWVVHESSRSSDSNYWEPSWITGILTSVVGDLYSFSEEIATPLLSFDEAVSVIGSTPPSTVERVYGFGPFWEDKVTTMLARVLST